MRLVDLSISRPVTVLMITLGLAIFGVVALSRLAVDLLPDVSYPSLTVRTEFPDAAPEDVEQFVTRPIEEAVGVVPGLTRMHSASHAGQSEVTLEFGGGTRMDLASLSVREKLDLVNLPREVKRPAIVRFDPSLDPILRYRLSGGGNLQRLRRISERTIKTELEGAQGVAAVKIAGGEEEEIHVDVDAARLSAVGVTLTQLTTRLGDENVNLAGGSLTQGQSEYLVRVANQFATPEEIAAIVLVSRPEGVVRVGDVAQVSRGAKERDIVARVNGAEAVEIAVYKEGDANTVAVARAVKSRVGKLALPGGMTMVTVADQSLFIERAIKDVVDAALIGSILSILVIFGFLRDLRSTAIISLSIPVSVLATFIIMYRLGLSLNLMSLGGLAMGVGMIVDDSIVVLESIWRKRQEHPDDLRTATARGAGTVAMAVVASTLTTVVVFLPLVFVQGLAGQLIRDQALTISFSLLASMLVALALVPTVAAIGARRPSHRHGAAAAAEDALPVSGASDSATPKRGRAASVGLWTLFVSLWPLRMLARGLALAGRVLVPLAARVLSPVEWVYERLLAAYPRVLRRALARPAFVLSGALALLLAALATFAVWPKDLIPSFAQGQFTFDVRLPEGTALAVTDRTLDSLAATIAHDPRVEFAYTSAGQDNLASFAGSAREPNRGQIAVAMRGAGDARAEDAIAGTLRTAMENVPGLTYEFSRPSLLTFRAPIEVEVYAHDLDTLRTVAAAVTQRLGGIRGIEDVESSVRSGDPEVQIAFDRDRLAAVGVSPATASRLVRNAVQGEAATQFSDADRKLDVRVRARAEDRTAVGDLATLEVGRGDGSVIPLGAVAQTAVIHGPGEIRRISQQRAAVVTANLHGRDLGSVSKDIVTAIGSLHTGEGTRVVLAGQNQDLAESFTSLRLAILLAIFLVYLVMASQFESLLHPFVIMFTLPLAVIGVVLTLVLTHTPVSVMVLIGMLVLSGIVVKNAIILVDYTNRLRATGLAKRDALIEAGCVRLRPILMTTLCTVLGLLPLAVGMGQGGEVGQPLALTIMGGLAFATVLTLVVIPVVYATLDRST